MIGGGEAGGGLCPARLLGAVVASTRDDLGERRRALGRLEILRQLVEPDVVLTAGAPWGKNAKYTNGFRHVRYGSWERAAMLRSAWPSWGRRHVTGLPCTGFPIDST